MTSYWTFEGLLLENLKGRDPLAKVDRKYLRSRWRFRAITRNLGTPKLYLLELSSAIPSRHFPVLHHRFGAHLAFALFYSSSSDLIQHHQGSHFLSFLHLRAQFTINEPTLALVTSETCFPAIFIFCPVKYPPLTR